MRRWGRKAGSGRAKETGQAAWMMVVGRVGSEAGRMEVLLMGRSVSFVVVVMVVWLLLLLLLLGGVGRTRSRSLSASVRRADASSTVAARIGRRICVGGVGRCRRCIRMCVPSDPVAPVRSYHQLHQ